MPKPFFHVESYWFLKWWSQICNPAAIKNNNGQPWRPCPQCWPHINGLVFIPTPTTASSSKRRCHRHERHFVPAPIIIFWPPDASQSSIIILIYQRKMRTVGERRMITYYVTMMAQRQNISPSAATTTHPTSPSLHSLDNHQLQTYARTANYQICPSHNISIPKAKDTME